MLDDVIETDRFVFFWGGWPSQWCKSTFRVDGVTYNCCEQFMMAEKARVFNDVVRLAQILHARSPREQKALGRKVADFDESVWNGICRDVVYRGNLARFTQNEDVAARVLATTDKTIVEASPKDPIWGIGLAATDPDAQDPSRWRGTNWLGIALMQVRESIRKSRRAAAKTGSVPCKCSLADDRP